MLESNHDREMLMRGGYPPHLKRRIASDLGHLSNSQAAEFLAAVAHPGLHVVIGHVSEQNNHPDLLERSFGEWRPRLGSLEYATQRGGSPWTTAGAGPQVSPDPRGTSLPDLQLTPSDGPPRQSADEIQQQSVE